MAMKIVYGVYQFLGFHITDYLLRKGDKVIGIDPETENGSGEMKEFYVRNANFKQLDSLKDLSLSDGKADVYMVLWNPGGMLVESLSFLEQLKERKELETNITIFSPLEIKEADIRSVRDVCTGHPSRKIDKWIYISSMYGPWMPEDSCVYEHILKGEYDKLGEVKPIYIEDFLAKFEEILRHPDTELAVWGEQMPARQADSGEGESILFKPQFCIPEQTSIAEGSRILAEHKKKLRMIEYWNCLLYTSPSPRD